MKSLVAALAMLTFSNCGWADNKMVKFVAPDNNEVLLVLWKIDSVARSGTKISIWTPSAVITVVPDPEAPGLKNMDGAVVFSHAFDWMLGHDSDLTKAAYDSAGEAVKAAATTVEARQKNAAFLLAFDGVFPCSSISIRDIPEK